MIVNATNKLGGSQGQRGEKVAAKNTTIQHTADQMIDFINQVIADRSVNRDTIYSDLLENLIQAFHRDQSKSDDSFKVTKDQLFDEMVTMLIAGAENPKNSLCWTLHMIHCNPKAKTKIYEELERLDKDTITCEDLESLPFLLKVYKECVRLFPPAYAFSRKAIEDVDIRGFQIHSGQEVVISPYAIHRNPKYYNNPAEFNPDNFSEKGQKMRPSLAFLPFGAGPRAWIGGQFAMNQGHIVLANLLNCFEFEHSVPKKSVKMLPLITLQPSSNFRMFVRRRR